MVCTFSHSGTVFNFEWRNGGYCGYTRDGFIVMAIEDGYWRPVTKSEIEDIISDTNIVSVLCAAGRARPVCAMPGHDQHINHATGLLTCLPFLDYGDGDCLDGFAVLQCREGWLQADYHDAIQEERDNPDVRAAMEAMLKRIAGDIVPLAPTD